MTIRWISTIIISSLLSNIALADCPNAVRLKVGDTVTDCERIGLSLDEDLRVREAIKNGEIDSQLVEEQKRLIDMKDLTIKDASDENKDLKDEVKRTRKEVDDSRGASHMELFIGMGIGIALTAIVAWEIQKVVQR